MDQSQPGMLSDNTVTYRPAYRNRPSRCTPGLERLLDDVVLGEELLAGELPLERGWLEAPAIPGRGAP